MQDEIRGAAPPSLPIVVLVGATRPQLRSFGLAIERAGYHTMVIEADRDVVENLSAQQADILAYNLEMGYTAILRGFRALPQHPALILLDEDRAIPADGFAANEQVPHTAEELEALLRRRLAPPTVPPLGSLPVVITPEEREALLQRESEPEEEIYPAGEAVVESTPPVAEETTASADAVAPPVVEEPVATPAVPESATLPTVVNEETPFTEASLAPQTRQAVTAPPRVRRREPRRRRIPSVVWQTALIVLGALALMWIITVSDAFRAGNQGTAAVPTSVATTDGAAGLTATETPLIAPEVATQAPAGPDLVARIIQITPAQPRVGDIVNVSVMVENLANDPAREDFWVDLYVSPDVVPQANQAWTDVTDPVSGLGATWQVQGLEAGEEIVLESLSADPNRSNLLRFSEAGPIELYVYVDSFGATVEGAVSEQAEDNNLVGPFDVEVGAAP